MDPDVETPLIGDRSSSSQSRSTSSVGKYLAVAAIIASAALILVFSGKISTVGISSTNFKVETPSFTFHVAGDETEADELFEEKAAEKARSDKLAAIAAIKSSSKLSSSKLSSASSGTSVNIDFVAPGAKMMSLVGAGPESSFNECSSVFKHQEDYLKIAVKPGCIAFFNNDISGQMFSKMITFCGCENIGPKKYDFVSLQRAGLIGRSGAGMISFIVTGPGASVTLYNAPEFESEYKTVIGPNTQISAKRMIRGEGTWDNEIYSVIMQSWTDCNAPPIVCVPETTQAPITHPTASPFIQPTANPTDKPVISPSHVPTEVPVSVPTLKPRARPTMSPLANPTEAPTLDPTKAPVAVPTHKPTDYPLPEPSQPPTDMPVNLDPTLAPTEAPTMDPRIVICKGKLASESKIIPGKTYPNPGCASFFWRNIDELDSSFISTICTCGEVGQMQVPNSLMAKVGAAKANGFPVISAIISGYNTSLTIYNTPDLTGVDKYVVGPKEIADLTQIERKSKAGVWNDQVKSLSMMAWNDCSQHLYTDSCFDF